jgi:hypothetical protein
VAEQATGTSSSRWIMRSLAVGLLDVGGRLVTHALLGAGLALLVVMARAATLDRTVLERRMLAMPSGSFQALAIGIAGVVLGDLILLALLWRRRKAT